MMQLLGQGLSTMLRWLVLDLCMTLLLLQLLPFPDPSAHPGEASQPSLSPVGSWLLEPGQRHLGWELFTAWFFPYISLSLDQEPSLLALAHPGGHEKVKGMESQGVGISLGSRSCSTA